MNITATALLDVFKVFNAVKDLPPHLVAHKAYTLARETFGYDVGVATAIMDSVCHQVKVSK